MAFRASAPELIEPVRPDEVVRPTHVAWRLPDGTVATRVLPTEARAFDLAARLEGVVSVEDARLPPPEQSRKRRLPKLGHLMRTT